VRKGGALRNGPVKRRVRALCGEVVVERQRYRCRGCGRSFYAGNAFLDSLGQRLMTDGVYGIARVLALYAPYEQSSALLGELLGRNVSASWLRREIVRRGTAESEKMGEAAHDRATFRVAPEPAAPSRSSGRQYVEMDGCFIHRWHKKGGMELKVGAVFSDPILRESKKRKWIEYKEYVGHLGESARFGERLYACAERWGVNDAEELYVLGDGASWIRSLHSEYFPHGELILDWWHVKDAVWRTVRALMPEEAERVFHGRRITSALFVGDVPRALKLVEQLPASSAKRQEKRGALYHYLESNRGSIPNYEATKARGIHIGSGVIENACMDTVGRRFKHRGMSWSPEGAEALLHLRVAHLNRRHSSYWPLFDRRRVA